MVEGSNTVTEHPHIALGLRPLAVPIDSLVPDPANAKVHGAKNLAVIRASLERFGQVKPLAVRAADRVVIAGNGRLQVAKALGWTHVAVVLMDGTPEQLAAFALVDNKSAELAEWDDTALAELMQVAEAGDVDLSGLGWNQRELDALLDSDEPLPLEPEIPVEVSDAPTAPAAPAEPPKAAAKPARAKDKVGKGEPPEVTEAEWAVLRKARDAMRADDQNQALTTGQAMERLSRLYLDRR